MTQRFVPMLRSSFTSVTLPDCRPIMEKTLVSEAYVRNGKGKIEEIPQRDEIIPPRWDDFGAF